MHLAARADVVNHFDTKLFAELDFRCWVAIRMTVAAIGKNIRMYFSQCVADAPIWIMECVLREHDAIDALYGFDNLFAFDLMHERSAFFIGEPVVVIEDDHELVPEGFSLLEHPYMSDMDRIKSA